MRSRPDPQQLAAAECRMWREYYEGNWLRLGRRLVRVLAQQFGLGRWAALRVGFAFGWAAMAFRRMYVRPEECRGGRQAVLKCLERGYARLERCTGMTFDPAQVAEAELAWWEVRREAGQASVERVGARIAALYAALYGGEAAAYLPAAGLRAAAAKRRDETEGHTDWGEIEGMLRSSYVALDRATQ